MFVASIPIVIVRRLHTHRCRSKAPSLLSIKRSSSICVVIDQKIFTDLCRHRSVSPWKMLWLLVGEERERNKKNGWLVNSATVVLPKHCSNMNGEQWFRVAATPFSSSSSLFCLKNGFWLSCCWCSRIDPERKNKPKVGLPMEKQRKIDHVVFSPSVAENTIPNNYVPRNIMVKTDEP